jgi:hypothetical protein
MAIRIKRDVFMKEYAFTPDCRNFVMAARNQAAPRLSLYEHLIGARMIAGILGRNPCPGMASGDVAEGYLNNESWSIPAPRRYAK